MRTSGYVVFGCALSIAGCAEGVPDTTDEGPGSDNERTGLSILAAVEADSKIDIAYVEYAIDRVACAEGESFDALHREIRAELLPMGLPGGIPGADGTSLDSASRHQFADHFEVVPPGCYDVLAAPLAADGNASAQCGTARQNDVRVADGDTTEIVLLSQCTGPEVGALDAAVAFNQPPQLVDLTFAPSKFIAAGERTTVCAKASDPNGDPLEFEWSQLGGETTGETTGEAAGEAAGAGEAGGEPAGRALISTEASPDANTACVGIQPDKAGTYRLEVRIFDQLRDQSGKLVRYEKVLASNGSPNLSNDSLRFAVHAGPAKTGTEPGTGPGTEPGTGPGREPGLQAQQKLRFVPRPH